MNWASSLIDDLILRSLAFEQVHAPQLRVEVLDRLRQSIKLHPHSLSPLLSIISTNVITNWLRGVRNRKLVSKVTISHDAEFYFGSTTKPPAQNNKVQYCEACLREAYLLTNILSCPYLFVRERGIAVATKLNFFLMGYGHPSSSSLFPSFKDAFSSLHKWVGRSLSLQHLQ